MVVNHIAAQVRARRAKRFPVVFDKDHVARWWWNPLYSTFIASLKFLSNFSAIINLRINMYHTIGHHQPKTLDSRISFFPTIFSLSLMSPDHRPPACLSLFLRFRIWAVLMGVYTRVQRITKNSGMREIRRAIKCDNRGVNDLKVLAVDIYRKRERGR